MTGTTWFVHMLYDIGTIILGSYGAFVLISEFVEMERPFLPSKLLAALQKRWYAALCLSLAVILFIVHIVSNLIA